MLSAKGLLTAAGIALSIAGPTWFLATAVADNSGTGVGCGAYSGDCTVSAGSSSPPSTTSSSAPSSGSGGGGGSTTCHFHGKAYDCYNATFGWFDEQDGCYYKLMDPQPDATSTYWAGHKPGDGAIYSEMCPAISGTGLPGSSGRWFQNPPPGYGGTVDVAALAQQAVSKMALVGPKIGIAPKPGGKSLVGLPVWLWDNVSPTTFGPNTATASAGGVTVTATGSVTQIAWVMGDGTTVTCTDAGTAYQPSFGNRKPDCGHVYTQTSAHQPGGAYPITATSTWVVNWQATTGQTGQITVTRQSTTSAVIGELQVLNHN